MKETYIKTIREACIKANPQGEYIIWACNNCQTVYGEYVNGCPKCWDENLTPKENREKYPDRAVTARDRSIHLADVLLAVRKEKWPGAEGHQVLMSRMTEADICGKWNLRADDLTLQDEPTLKFISELLTKHS